MPDIDKDDSDFLNGAASEDSEDENEDLVADDARVNEDKDDSDSEEEDEEEHDYENVFKRKFSVEQQKKYYELLKQVYRVDLQGLLSDEGSSPSSAQQSALYFLPTGLPECFFIEVLTKEGIIPNMLKAFESKKVCLRSRNSPARKKLRKTKNSIVLDYTQEEQLKLFKPCFTSDGDYPQVFTFVQESIRDLFERHGICNLKHAAACSAIFQPNDLSTSHMEVSYTIL